MIKIFKTITMTLLKNFVILFVLLFLISSSEYKKDNIITLHQIKNNVVINKIPEIEKLIKKKIVDEYTIKKIDNYLDLNEMIQEAFVQIPILNNFIPQGITLVDGNYFITGYYETHKNSSCYIIDELGKIINIVELDTNSHVGSVSYDKKRKLLWIPDNNWILNAYSVSDFYNKKEVKTLYTFDYVSQDLIDFQNNNKNLIAYLCVDNDYIYIGNFFIDYDCIVKKYQIIDIDGNLLLNYVNKFNVPKRSQSIDLFDYNQKKYMLLSQSYGRRNPSYLYLYEYKENRNVYSNTELKKIKMPPMLEQISVYNNLLYLLFESNASKYWNCSEKVEFVLAISLLEILKTT